MKKNTLLLFCILLVINITAQNNRSATSVMDEAFSKAKKENKNVFVKFSASWCVWCKKMDNSINDTVCKKQFEDNFVFATLIVDEKSDKKHLENQGADSLILKYNGKRNSGIPFWYILNQNGELLADCFYTNELSKAEDKKSMIGCPAKEAEVNAFIEILKRTSKINTTDLEKIRIRFRANDYVPKVK
ncbi:MAG: thioredoxin family protein [Chitinophagaceae bacterium]|nr:thioredoxin family protein [Chitinophagaceae bacterium]